MSYRVAAGRKTSLSNLLSRVRVSDEKFTIGLRDDAVTAPKYVLEKEYIELLERSRVEKEEAYRRGHEEGRRSGLEDGMQEARKVAESFNRLAADVEAQRAEIYRQAESEVIDLAMEIAKKIIGVKAEFDPELVIDAARKAVRLLLDRSTLVIKVSPEQESFVRERLDDLYAIDDRIQRVTIESDRRIAPGGCVLETDSGNVDARIETEIQAITDSLRKANASHSDN